jgi:tetratricopeptide (TPR) repeat protein
MRRPPKTCFRVSILVLSCVTQWLVAPARAQTTHVPADTPEELASVRESLSLLRHGRFDDLDRKMNGLQRAYERGSLGDERLLHEFRAFYDTDPALEVHYNEWIEKLPNSYAAWLARGIYFRYLGTEARGSRYVSETPRHQLDEMTTYTDKAMRDYDKSLTLTEKALISYHAILGVAMLHGDDDLAKKMLAESVRIDARNFVVRYKYFNTLQTRWGGSLQQMLDFEQEARAAGLSEAQLKYFDNMIAVERQWLKHLVAPHLTSTARSPS